MSDGLPEVLGKKGTWPFTFGVCHLLSGNKGTLASKHIFKGTLENKSKTYFWGNIGNIGF